MNDESSWSGAGLWPKPRVSLQFRCPRCTELSILTATDIPDEGARIQCPSCGLDFERNVLPPRPGEPVRSCWLCGCDDLYIQKDSNPWFVLPILLVGGILALLTMTVVSPVLGLLCVGFLGWGLLSVHRLLATCTVCYLCHSIYRGAPPDPRQEAFFHAWDAKQEEPRKEWVERLGRAAPSGELRGSSP